MSNLVTATGFQATGFQAKLVAEYRAECLVSRAEAEAYELLNDEATAYELDGLGLDGLHAVLDEAEAYELDELREQEAEASCLTDESAQIAARTSR